MRSQMLDSDSFEMADTLNRAVLERHPVWSLYNERRDRALITGWGVAREVLDREIERFDFCGTQLLFPVLEIDPLPPVEHLLVAARFTSESATVLPGYLLEPHAFGIFVGDREFTFNRHLSGASQTTARKLADALREDPESLFPLRYTTGLRSHDGRALEGRFERCW